MGNILTLTLSLAVLCMSNSTQLSLKRSGVTFKEAPSLFKEDPNSAFHKKQTKGDAPAD